MEMSENLQKFVEKLLSLEGEELTKFVADRCASLEQEERTSFFTRDVAVSRFFRRGEGVREAYNFAPLFIDDNVGIVESFVQKLKEVEDPKTLEGVVCALQTATDDYFGGKENSAWRDSAYTSLENLFDEDFMLALSDFKNLNVALCFERSIFVHQCLKFLGIDDNMVTGVCRFGDHAESHVFNVLKVGDAEYIFDVTNPKSKTAPYFLQVGSKENGIFVDEQTDRKYDMKQLSASKDLSGGKK